MLCFGVFLTCCLAHFQEEDSGEVGKIRKLLAAAQESTSFHTWWRRAASWIPGGACDVTGLPCSEEILARV